MCAAIFFSLSLFTLGHQLVVSWTGFALHLHYIWITFALHLHYICTTFALTILDSKFTIWCAALLNLGHQLVVSWTEFALHLNYICTAFSLHLHCNVIALHLHCTIIALHLHCANIALHLQRCCDLMYYCSSSASKYLKAGLHFCYYICTVVLLNFLCTGIDMMCDVLRFSLSHSVTSLKLECICTFALILLHYCELYF